MYGKGLDFMIYWNKMTWLWLTGFQIHVELLLRFCSVQVPSWARAKSQMTTDGMEKNKGQPILEFMLKGPLIELNLIH